MYYTLIKVVQCTSKKHVHVGSTGQKDNEIVVLFNRKQIYFNELHVNF